MEVTARHIICRFFFPPGYVALQNFKTPHRPAGERVSWCLETSSRLPPRDGSPSLTLLSIFLSFIFCPTSFWREWTVFLGAWCPLPAFRNCFVEFAQCSNDLSMNLWGRKWSPHPIPPPSSALQANSEFIRKSKRSRIVKILLKNKKKLEGTPSTSM